MSHISNTLDELLNASKLKAAELASTSEVNASHISRIRSGVQVWVSPKELMKLAEAFAKRIEGTSSQAIHAQLLLARLRDERIGPGADQISIELRSSEGTPVERASISDRNGVLPPRIQENLDTIGEHIGGSRHVRDLIENIANFCRRENLPTRHS